VVLEAGPFMKSSDELHLLLVARLQLIQTSPYLQPQRLDHFVSCLAFIQMQIVRPIQCRSDCSVGALARLVHIHIEDPTSFFFGRKTVRLIL
jgi:hypothetical protein